MNLDNNNKNYEAETTSIKEYLMLIRTNLIPIIIITLAALSVAVIYALNATNIYKSTAFLKIEKPQGGSLLSSPLLEGYSDFGNDRFLANEIEILKSWRTRERVAKAITDTFLVVNNPDTFFLVLDRTFEFEDSNPSLLDEYSMIDMLGKSVVITQKRGIDFIEVSVESPSPFEAALISNIYAKSYKDLNLYYNRAQLTSLRRFLKTQRDSIENRLILAENRYLQFQEEGGIIALPEQAGALIQQLTDFEAKMNAAKIELSMSEKGLAELKDELGRLDPKFADYIESLMAEPTIVSYQEEIARLETQKARAQKSVKSRNNELIVKQNQRIREVQDLLDQEIEKKRAGMLGTTPEEFKALSQKVLDEEVRYQGLLASYTALSQVVEDYNIRFNELPNKTIGLARFEREKQSFEKLYLLIEEKYQESLITERSTAGDVTIVDPARVSKADKPAKPNRILIVAVGLFLGLGMGLGYAFLKNYFDTTIKTPEDIQKLGINVLAWIPQIEVAGNNKDYEFIVARKPDSIPAEAFRALRTRIQFSKIERDSVKAILVTSSTPKEGKTTVSVNLAGSFAHSNKKTIIIDCDLRKPRMHNVFKEKRFPGFTDYFFGQASFEEILRKSELNNLYFITAGTIPPNPSEILGSPQMEEFLKKLRAEFDMVVLDSPPVVAVTDSEILSSLVDATILVVSADKTEVQLVEKSSSMLKHQHGSFLGVLLNNFSYRSGYGSYYKYYYYYSRPDNGTAARKKSKAT